MMFWTAAMTRGLSRFTRLLYLVSYATLKFLRFADLHPGLHNALGTCRTQHRMITDQPYYQSLE